MIIATHPLPLEGGGRGGGDRVLEIFFKKFIDY